MLYVTIWIKKQNGGLKKNPHTHTKRYNVHMDIGRFVHIDAWHQIYCYNCKSNTNNEEKSKIITMICMQ